MEARDDPMIATDSDHAPDALLGLGRTPARLTAAVAQLRRELEAGHVEAVERLDGLLRTVTDDLPAGQGADAAAWHALADEIARLVEEIARQRDLLAEQARALARHRRAGTAYHRAERGP
jgi:UDP-N-acetylglucosamine 2-epimerase